MRTVNNAFRHKPSPYLVVAVFAAALAVVRICASYHSLSQTWDETAHLACGMQLLDRGEYHYEVLHPPTARLSAAFLPYLDGARSHGDSTEWIEGNEILFHQHSYWRTLTLARLGILPFFILAVAVLWMWSKRLFGEQPASIAVVLFSLLPPILAHAGLATTDMPVTAMFLASCFVFWWWLEHPTPRRSMFLGFVLGTAASTKFSFLFFFPPAALVLAAYQFFICQRTTFSGRFFLKTLGHACIIGIMASLTIWAWYGFSYDSLVPSAHWLRVERLIKISILPGVNEKTIGELIRMRVPAPEFFRGIIVLVMMNHGGSVTYLLGQTLYGHASAWFFPVALALKTPIAFLILAIDGSLIVLWGVRSKSPAILPLLIALAIMTLCVFSNLNLGLRHIIPIYPFLAMLGAVFAVKLIRYRSPYGIVGFGLLIGWIVVSSFQSGNDRIAYFNEFAGDHPEYFLLGSDLDWGQDLDKLADTLRARNISYLEISYDGSADLAQHGFPRFDTLKPFTTPETHWIAISKSFLYSRPGFAWLKMRLPVATAGNCMVLYYLP